MARKLGFRKPLRQQRLESLAGQSFYAASMDAGPRRDAAMARLEADRAAIKPVRERAAPRKLEAPVIAAISELLAVHPRVIWAMRVNSGSAVAASGAPVWFHKFVRRPEPMRMTDFFGLVKSYNGKPFYNTIPLAIEAKAPGWTKPRDDREREQEAFLAMIRDAGGIGIFAISVDDVAKALG